MTVDQVRAAVAEIERASGDFEVAHSLEDNLHGDVLVAIANGAVNADALASEALKTRLVKFRRVTA